MSRFAPEAAFVAEALGNGGINGGNPAGDVWFCGIEFGLKDGRAPSLDMDLPLRSHTDSEFPYWTDAYLEHIHLVRNGGRDPVESFPFMQKMARIVLGWEGAVPEPSLEDVKAYVKQDLCRRGRNTFQLNLYPLAFNSASDALFVGRHRELTGFPNKGAYRLWCREQRFPRLRQLVRDHQPRALLGVGSTYEEDYRLAFLEPPQRYGSPNWILDLPRSGRPVFVFAVESTTSLLAIAPFLGQGGIMANDDLDWLGRTLRELAEGR